jgi:hypothetical protein
LLYASLDCMLFGVRAREASAMTRAAIIPAGSWPRRMSAPYAAGYCGEASAEAFLRRVGSEYPQPAVNDGRRRLWLRDDLDRAMGVSDSLREIEDAAAVL